MRPIALELAKKQREISVAEFFEKNRHLLGFDNKRKALLTTIKEAVDNALDACEEAHILPSIKVEIIQLGEERYRVIVEDNGPGIVKRNVPDVFGKLLYGSKFHRLKQARGQQGIGISAACLYAQLTSGKPIKVISKIAKNKPAKMFELRIDTKRNSPIVLKEQETTWNREHGIRIELELEALYQKGGWSVDNYLKQTAIVNPHASIVYVNPLAEQFIFPRVTEKLPKEPKEIKPHPHGIELGMLMKMLGRTKARSIAGFLTSEFSRIGEKTASSICQNAGLRTSLSPKKVTLNDAEAILKAISKTRIMAPPADCIVPIGQEMLEKGLKKEIKAEFYCAVSRPPSVYRGNPFCIEAAIAYGGEQPTDKTINLLRFANRVPLLYQQGACAITKSAMAINWRKYGLSQSKNSLPIGPCTIAVHIASAWVPFTSESKEAIAHYPEIVKEIKLCLQECGRQLASYINKKRRIQDEVKKRSYIEIYIPHLSAALKDLLDASNKEKEKIENLLKKILERKRGKLKEIKVENAEYDEEFAKIGKEQNEA